METAIITKRAEVGLCLPALIRNILLADCGLRWDQCVTVADAIQSRILDADWVSLDDGTTMEVTWYPRHASEEI